MLTLDFKPFTLHYSYNIEKFNSQARSCQEPYNLPIHEKFVHFEILNNDQRLYHDGWQIVHAEPINSKMDLKFLRQLAKRAMCIQYRQKTFRKIKSIKYPTYNSVNEIIILDYTGNAQPFNWIALNNYVEPKLRNEIDDDNEVTTEIAETIH